VIGDQWAEGGDRGRASATVVKTMNRISNPSTRAAGLAGAAALVTLVTVHGLFLPEYGAQWARRGRFTPPSR
jgi:hypothetical protein